MKKTKSIICYALALLIIVLAFASCSNLRSNVNKETIHTNNPSKTTNSTSATSVESTSTSVSTTILSSTSVTTTATEAPTTSIYESIDFSEYFFETTYSAWVHCPSSVLKVYKYPATNSKVVVMISNTNSVEVLGMYENWYIIKIDSNTFGFAKKISNNNPLLEIKTLQKTNVSDTYNYTLIGSAETSATSKDPNRATNLKISSEAASIIIPNGDSFSMNQTTGPRSASSGYKEAAIFVNGSVANGLGGGVCQTTTTIHMGVKDAIKAGYNFTIVEANKHSRSVSYVSSRAQEAMVSWGTSDFRFINQTGYDVALVITSENQTVTAKIFLIN